MNPVKCYNFTVPIASIDHFDLVLESYVVKNRSRILSLLNIPDPVKTTPDPGCHQVGASDLSTPLLGNGSASTCTASIYNERKMAVTDF